jgi:proline dehydrogenase
MKYRKANKGVLFAYSVEVDESEAVGSSSQSAEHDGNPELSKKIVDEMVHSVDVAADFEEHIIKSSVGERKTWVAVKMVTSIFAE